MTLDELIEALQAAKTRVSGTTPVYLTSQDYPDKVRLVSLMGDREPYYCNPPYIKLET